MFSFLVLVIKAALLHLSVEQVIGSSITHADEVAVQDQTPGNLSKPSAYIIGPDRTTLVVCKGRQSRISSILDLALHCKGLRHKARLQHFLTTNDDIPSVTTARLIVTPYVVKKNRQDIICYCIDVSTKEKSSGLVISMKPAPRNSILPDSNHFKPNRNRKKTVTLHSSTKLSWRFPNSSEVYCLHDGQSLSKDRVVYGKGKISAVINEALRRDAGFYYCRTKSGAFSSWLKLQVKGGWSKWRPWLACSSKCGPGKMIETRRCLETRRERCQGRSVRVLPCVGHSCEGIVPQFVNQPADQVIHNGSSTNVTCAAGYRSSLFTVQMFCSSNDWKIRYFPIQNKTTAGSVLNNTVARITYKVELHRDKSELAAIYCRCYASTIQLSTRSRIAKIVFPSAEGDYSHSLMTSPASTTTGSRVKASATEDTKENSNSLNPLITVVGISVTLVFLLTTVILFLKSRKRYLHQTSRARDRPTEESIPSLEKNVIESYETERVRYIEPPDTKIITLHSSVSSEDRASNNPLLKCSMVMTQAETDCDKLSVFQRGESWKSNKSAYSSVSAAFCPMPKLPDTVDPDFCAHLESSNVPDPEMNNATSRERPRSCETKYLRYLEPPVKEGDTIENRASNTPLIYFEDPLEPVDHEDSAPHLSVVMAEETDSDNESVFQRGESWKSNKSAYSSVSAAFCPKPKLPDTVDPDLCAWGQFTEKGGRLTIEGTGVRLYIPPNALPEQTSQVIYIGLMNSKGKYPKLNDQEALLSPVVVCGPDGLTFERPVFLTVPHNAVLDENNCWDPKVQSCSSVDEKERDNRWKILERPGGDAPLSHVSDKEMQIMIDHFTNFAVVGEASSTQELSAKLKAWIIAYYTEPTVDGDLTTRVYCIPATDAAYKVLEGIESKLNGKMSDSQKLLQIRNNDKDLQITSKMTYEGWSAVTGEQKSIPFDIIWQCPEQSPNVSFIFERVSTQVFKFRSTFDVRQEESVKGVEVQVCFSIKDNRRTSSGYESQANGCQLDAQYKIPIEVRRELCHLLDPEDPMFNDWRHFAQKLGLRKVYIHDLKDNDKIKSPTDKVIEMWEMTLSENKPLSLVEEIFREMERYDAVKVLQKIAGLKSTGEELNCSVSTESEQP